MKNYKIRNKFFKKRLVLIGDAAVGMHPVTAQGFNLNLKGIEILYNLKSLDCSNNHLTSLKEIENLSNFLPSISKIVA